jgi:hypothetical protein
VATKPCARNVSTSFSPSTTKTLRASSGSKTQLSICARKTGSFAPSSVIGGFASRTTSVVAWRPKRGCSEEECWPKSRPLSGRKRYYVGTGN